MCGPCFGGGRIAVPTGRVHSVRTRPVELGESNPVQYWVTGFSPGAVCEDVLLGSDL